MLDNYSILKWPVFTFYLLWVVTFINPHNSFADNYTCLNIEEEKLYNLVNKDRMAHGLKQIPLSSSLTLVAQTHARDLQQNPSIVNNHCNMHSWSELGDWTSCCYTPDHAQARCMWEKPKELSPYTGYGFELSYRNSANATAFNALKSWSKSYAHYSVIINRESWKNREWSALGVGIYEQYAVLWFGVKLDLNESPKRCGKKYVVKLN